MVSENKTRYTVTLSNNLAQSVDTLCEQMGVTRSQFIAMAVGEKVMQYNKSTEIATELLGKFADTFKPMA